MSTLRWQAEGLHKEEILTSNDRQNPAVIGQAGKMFVMIAQALESDALQGQTVTRVVAATKALLANAGVDPAPLLQQFPAESQQRVAAYFA